MKVNGNGHRHHRGWMDGKQFAISEHYLHPQPVRSKDDEDILDQMRMLGWVEYGLKFDYSEDKRCPPGIEKTAVLTDTGRRLYMEDKRMSNPLYRAAVRIIGDLVY